MPLNWPSKDPDELLDYSINWAQALGTDTITASTWEISPDGLTEDHNTYVARLTTIWLSGGAINQQYLVTNTITTAGGRIFQQSVNIRVVAN